MIAGVIGVFALAVFGFFVVPKQFFPYAERLELFLQLRLPEGSSIGASLEAAKQAEALLKDDPDAALYTSYVGQGPPRFWLGLNPQLPNEAYSEIVIVAKDIEARERLKKKLETAIANGALPQARARVDRFYFGPPVGFPVQFRVVGSDPATVRAIAYQVRDVMRGDEGVDDPHLNWNEQTPRVRLVIDQDRARLLGLTPQDVSNRLRLAISGVTITTLRDGIDQVEVVARAIPQERGDLSRIGDMVIYARDGKAVTVSQVAKIVYDHEEPIILAAQSRHEHHGALRRQGRRAGAGCDDAHLAAACADSRASSARAIGSKWAARSRNRKRATRRSLRFFRSSASSC